ncbi:hypothetical protein PSQ90_10990 [Devosia rhodophyticola]|uniref:DUF4262 domain-containing protein n=1 Tax=Devosia rhodophyticola TaxID=3026423 RepID=A0ABY7YUA6_9HYPH|nr:hypothetical protein [Devosia rhodophyticola]WDR04834.1 hypothetical protein PSQ90_10990 [Devosia rhodophyticola]
MDADDDEETWGAQEAGAWFEQAPELGTHLAIYQQVLVAYGFRCALTGAAFEPISQGVHGDLAVVAIRPRELGGPLHVSNFLSLSNAAASAFARGHWLIGDDYSVVTDRDVMAPAFAEKLDADGKLFLPKDRLYHPDRVQLAWHRTRILGRP